ncbi:LysR family transcriptional regulator [Paracoccus sp. Z330]|uniref:LysR family transcriptional regulator n=1 Tax=Paracoccus onchidii TaxID=3017813 RepID=A0ABT4ZJ90_9RHOB|nr:LysR family transcriptional regulator [Paracoccus onchidii]MDB6179391.1 LysR family transcriptional regulator [Paracoccus onchidii]
MIDDYRGLAVFVAIVEAGSFSEAGRRLKLSTSVVSHHLSRLEAKMGVTLFFRSTRSMSLTPEGQAALGPARRMVAAGEEALDFLGAGSEEPVGSLKISMPAFGEKTRLRQRLWEFSRRHPMVAITLHNSDKRDDLVKGGFDLAIRLGTLSDSSLKSRKIGTFRRALVASPAYLASCPPIRSIEDLQNCEFVSIAMLPDTLTLWNQGKSKTISTENTRLEVDTIGAAKSAVIAGLGVQHLPYNEVSSELLSGELAVVLPDWTLPELGIYAVWPEIGPQKQLTRRLLKFLTEDELS